MATLLVSVNFNSNVGAVESYNTNTGRLLSRQRLPGIPTGLAVSRNALFVGNASDRASIIARIAQNQARIFADPPVGTTDLAIGPNGNLFSLSRQGFIQEFDGRTGAFVKTVAIGTTFTTGITFGADGALYASTVRGNIERINPNTGQILGTDGLLIPGPRDLAFDRFGRLFVITARNGNTIELRGPQGPITFVRGLRTPTAIAFSPEGNLFVADAGYGGVAEFDGRNGAFRRFYQTGGTPQYIAFSTTRTSRAARRTDTRDSNQQDMLTGLKTEQNLVGAVHDDQLANYFAKRNGNRKSQDVVAKQMKSKSLVSDARDKVLMMGFDNADPTSETSQRRGSLQSQRWSEPIPFDINFSKLSSTTIVSLTGNSEFY